MSDHRDLVHPPAGAGPGVAADGPALDPASVPEISDPEDVKIVTLARSVLARHPEAGQGAAVRDTMGRTYAGTSVGLPSLSLSAVQVAVAMAVSSGADGIEAVAVAGAAPGSADVAAVREFAGSDVPFWLAGAVGDARRWFPG